MNNTQQKRSLGLLLAFLGTFLFALKSIFIKLAYFEGLNSDVVNMDFKANKNVPKNANNKPKERFC
jgi:hypothetical protein